MNKKQCNLNKQNIDLYVIVLFIEVFRKLRSFFLKCALKSLTNFGECWCCFAPKRPEVYNFHVDEISIWRFFQRTLIFWVPNFLPFPLKRRLHHGHKSKSSLQSSLQGSKLLTENLWQQVHKYLINVTEMFPFKCQIMLIQCWLPWKRKNVGKTWKPVNLYHLFCEMDKYSQNC